MDKLLEIITDYIHEYIEEGYPVDKLVSTIRGEVKRMQTYHNYMNVRYNKLSDGMVSLADTLPPVTFPSATDYSFDTNVLFGSEPVVYFDYKKDTEGQDSIVFS